MTPSLVMAAGSAPGAGTSTLIERLAAAMRADAESVEVVWEDDVWGARRIDDQPVSAAIARAEFVELLRDPSADRLAATFDQISAGITTDHWLQDWTWHDLAAAAQQPPGEALHALVSRLVEHHATVLYLEVDPEVALSRALAERGPIWLQRHAVGLGLADTATIAEMAGWYGTREQARRERLRSAAVSDIAVDASGSIASVVDAARQALVRG